MAKDHPFVRGKTIDEWAVDWASTGSSVGPVWRFYRQLWLCRNFVAARARAAVASAATAAAATGVRDMQEAKAEACVREKY